MPTTGPAGGERDLDRLVENPAGHDTGLDSVPKRGSEKTVWVLVQRPRRSASITFLSSLSGPAPPTSAPTPLEFQRDKTG
jgi:hypothetical protein